LVFRQLRAWATYRHPNKGHKWIARKYWSIRDGWEFGVQSRIKLVRLMEIPIQRHTGLRTGKSPYDGDWVYWSRRLGQYPDVPKSVAIRLRLQNGVCAQCGLYFQPDDQVEILHLDGDAKVYRRENMALVHKRCVASMRSVHMKASLR
jgi:RNA-directed DNA polymerase